MLGPPSQGDSRHPAARVGHGRRKPGRVTGLEKVSEVTCGAHSPHRQVTRRGHCPPAPSGKTRLLPCDPAAFSRGRWGSCTHRGHAEPSPRAGPHVSCAVTVADGRGHGGASSWSLSATLLPMTSLPAATSARTFRLRPAGTDWVAHKLRERTAHDSGGQNPDARPPAALREGPGLTGGKGQGSSRGSFS